MPRPPLCALHAEIEYSSNPRERKTERRERPVSILLRARFNDRAFINPNSRAYTIPRFIRASAPIPTCTINSSIVCYIFPSRREREKEQRRKKKFGISLILHGASELSLPRLLVVVGKKPAVKGEIIKPEIYERAAPAARANEKPR